MANGSGGYAKINKARKAGTGKPTSAKKRAQLRARAKRLRGG
jgi:hypothetical protein